jgi:hypothetical protein
VLAANLLACTKLATVTQFTALFVVVVVVVINATDGKDDDGTASV